MDCEKYEPLLLDELYDELDELTSAAVKRHVSGCARCAGILQGMRGTRRSIDLPIVLPSPELEERILAAAREAQKVVPFRARASRLLSRAGSWAMRPQTAMAAVFLLMIGSSAFLVRARRDASAPAGVSVTVAGEPAPAAAPADHDTLTDPATAAAHGAVVAQNAPPPAAIGSADDAMGDSRVRAERKEIALAKPAATAAGPAGKAANVLDMGDPTASATTAGAEGEAQQKKPSAAQTADTSDAFAAGMTAYRARSFNDAAQKFDVAAQGGDPNAALWAAKSTRDGSGCAVALGRFDALARRAAGTWYGNEADLEAARCQIALGQLDAARARLQRLRSVPSHAAAAQRELAELDAIAARRNMDQSGAGSGGAAAGRAAPAAPAMRAAPAPAPAKLDTDQGF